MPPCAAYQGGAKVTALLTQLPWEAVRTHWYRIESNKTRQGYARKRILKLAGYLFVGCAA